MLSETGSLGPFLDATLARSRRIENSEIPIDILSHLLLLLNRVSLLMMTSRKIT